MEPQVRVPIALTGFMGVGKSSVGRHLAGLLELPFHDSDEVVEERGGRTVESYFPSQEPAFRRLEAEVVAELLQGGPSVIALGGGALLDARTRDLLLQRSVLVHLHVPWQQVSAYLPGMMESRPLLRGRSLADIERLYEERLESYRQATLTVEIGRRGPAQAADHIRDALAAGGFL